jgi:hypothetical protein
MGMSHLKVTQDFIQGAVLLKKFSKDRNLSAAGAICVLTNTLQFWRLNR